MIKKGETAKVEIPPDIAKTGFHNRNLQYIAESGKLIVSAGTNSDDVISTEIYIR